MLTHNPTCLQNNAEADTMAARGHATHLCATKKNELGIFGTGKQVNCKTYGEIVMIVFFLSFPPAYLGMLKILAYKLHPDRAGKLVCKLSPPTPQIHRQGAAKYMAQRWRYHCGC